MIFNIIMFIIHCILFVDWVYLLVKASLGYHTFKDIPNSGKYYIPLIICSGIMIVNEIAMSIMLGLKIWG